MARIAGVDLPKNKRGEIGLTYIYGIGPSTAKYILDKNNISRDKKVHEWNDDDLNAIRNTITEELKVEGQLRSEVQMSIKRLLDIACYRGLRHRKRGEIGLTYIYGIGPSTAKYILDKNNISRDKKVHEWNDDDLNAIRNTITEELKVEGQLRSEVQMSIKRLLDIACYRGLRHRK